MEKSSDQNQKILIFSKAFINASKSVFETMVFTKIVPQKPVYKTGSVSSGDISSIMGLTGKIEEQGQQFTLSGMFILSWPENTFLKVASAMLSEEFKQVNDSNIDVGAEINNMITGNAKRELNSVGVKIDMAIPSVISGTNHHINYPHNSTTVMIPIVSGHGEFFMEICYKIEQKKNT